jgi:hypothetical protein
VADENGTVHRQLLVVTAAISVAALAIPAVIAGMQSAHASTASQPPASTAKVTRTDLSSTVQVAGSIGYDGSYTIAAPSGGSAQAVMQAQSAVAGAQAALAADRTSASDDSAANAQSVAQAEAAVTAAQATVTADTAKQSSDCAGAGAASPGCASDGQSLTRDQAQVAQQQAALSAARLNATRAGHQDQAKMNNDILSMQNAQAALALVQRTAVNSGSFYTALPTLGQAIQQGQPVYSVDGRPVPLFYGTVTAWRVFSLGMDDGPDVGELNQNLLALGFGRRLTPSNHFSRETADAVKRWQASLGTSQTGVIRLGDVVFEPGPIRVSSVHTTLGGAVSPGPIFDATTTNRIVTVALSVGKEYLVHAGDAVSVVLPDGKSTAAGHVRSVATVATAPANNSSDPTVTVTITLDDSAASGRLDQAPVNVNITDQAVHGILAVPINALLVLAEGGDAVEVVSGGTRHLVGVSTGLFSQTMVEISGAGITEGTLVEVPAA